MNELRRISLLVLACCTLAACKSRPATPKPEEEKVGSSAPAAPEEQPPAKGLSPEEKAKEEAAQSPLACALYLTGKIESDDDRLDALLDIADRLEGDRQADVMQDVLDLAENHEEPDAAFPDLVRIAWLHLEAGRKGEAKTAMSRIRELADATEPSAHVERYSTYVSELATMHAKLGQKKESAKLVKEVVELVDPSMIDLDDRATVIANCAEVGEHEKALQLATDIPDAYEWENDQVRADLAISYVWRDEIDRALEIGKALGTSLEKARALESAGAALLDDGRDEEALEVLEEAVTAIRKVQSEEYSARPFARTARLIAQAGEVDRARGLLEMALEQAKKIEDYEENPGYGQCQGYPEPYSIEIDGDLPQTEALVEVARGFREAGDPEAAATTIDLALVESKGIKEESDRYLARLSIVREYIELGRLSWAQAAAKRIKDETRRARAFVLVAMAYEMKGKTKSASALFDEHIPLLDQQSAGDVALELEQAGLRERALQAAARIASQSRARDLLPLVLGLEPIDAPADDETRKLLEKIIEIAG